MRNAGWPINARDIDSEVLLSALHMKSVDETIYYKQLIERYLRRYAALHYVAGDEGLVRENPI